MLEMKESTKNNNKNRKHKYTNPIECALHMEYIENLGEMRKKIEEKKIINTRAKLEREQKYREKLYALAIFAHSCIK